MPCNLHHLFILRKKSSKGIMATENWWLFPISITVFPSTFSWLCKIYWNLLPLIIKAHACPMLARRYADGANAYWTGFFSVILLKMTPVNITVISVKKNEIPSNGSTTVQSAAFLLIVTVFLGKIQMSSNTYNGR